MGRFLLGVLAGGGSLIGAWLLVLLGVGMAELLLIRMEGAPRPMRMDGGVLSRLGAQRVEVLSNAWRVRLSCKGECDDLIVPWEVQRITAADVRGRCVACDKAPWWNMPGLRGPALRPAERPPGHL